MLPDRNIRFDRFYTLIISIKKLQWLQGRRIEKTYFKYLFLYIYTHIKRYKMLSFIEIYLLNLYSYRVVQQSPQSILECFYHTKMKTSDYQQLLSIPSTSWPLPTTDLFSVSTDLTIWYISHKWNNTIFLCLVSFTQHNVFKVHQCHSMCQHCIPFYD